MPHEQVPTLDRTSVPDLICDFLGGPQLTGGAQDDLARFLTGSCQEALGRFFSQPAPAANADVLRYRHDLVARHLAPATINRRFAAIRSLTKLARLPRCRPVGHRGPGRAPGDAQRHPRAGGVETVAEMLRLAAEPSDSHAVRNVAMLRVMFDLALRVSEVRQLDVADLQLDRGALWVSGKGRAEKEVLSLPERTHGAITAWLRVRAPHRVHSSSQWDPDGTGSAAEGGSPHAASIASCQNWASRQAPRCGRMGCGIPPSPVPSRPLMSTASRWTRSGSSAATRTSINTLLVYRNRVRDVQGQLAALVAGMIHCECKCIGQKAGPAGLCRGSVAGVVV